MLMKSYRFNLDKLQIVFEDPVIETMFSKAQVHQDTKERGGLLLGRLYPDENLIVVVEAMESPAISSKNTEIYVDNDVANRDMKKRWEDSNGKITYVGDWHTHPERTPSPSCIDTTTFKDTYRSSKMDQNFLICAIVGTTSIDKGGLWVGVQRWFRLYTLHYDIKNRLFWRKKSD
jgi:integrative and conjugative element protein (TIGR02256 family)